MIPYIIQVAAFQLVFLMIYDAFLKKETFFNWNRIYLLITAVLSVIMPFIKLEVFKNTIPQQYIINLPEVIIGNASPINQNAIQLETVIIESKPFWAWENVLYAGIILSTGLFAFKIAKVILMLIKNPKSKFGNLLIINLLNSNVAFSFFHYVFLGERLNEKDKDAILKHEMVHVKEKHTCDLLFFEVMRILFWFNPLVYTYQNRIMTLHEFIADQEAVKHQDKSQYYQNLLSQVFQTQNISFINPFFKQSLIKKRIVMLQKSKSKQIKLFKYMLLIPIVFGMLVYTSSYGQEKNKSEGQEKTTQPSTSIGVIKSVVHNNYSNEVEVPFAVVEEVPLFPDCEKLSSKEEKMDCTSTSISEHVSKNFDTALATKLGLVGRQRITVLFKISAEGNIVDAQARAPHPALEKEAIRVVNTFPKMIPGKQKGKLVVVPYALPIIFMVADNIEKNNADKNPEIITVHERLMSNEVTNNDDVEVPFAVIEQVPVFPGCEDLASNSEKRRCMSEKIQEFVGKNFNTNIASQNGLVGRQRITTVFKIDREGNIVGIQSRASHPALEAETIRVIKLLPKMQPGKQRGEPVIVPYSLPIVFVVQGDKPELEKK